MFSKSGYLTLLSLLLVLLFTFTACAPAATQAPEEPAQEEEAPGEEPAAEEKVSDEIILATTTSTRDSGLLDELLPIFEEETGYMVKMVAVGTGKALEMGQNGDADVLLVHAPPAEMEFMDGGYGKDRLLIMHNDFVIVGPADDPAGIKGMASAADAFAAIAGEKAAFVSRGDDSGTNKKELAIWADAGMTPEASDWYLESGQGMGDSLRIANEKAAHILTDRATYLANSETLDLEILVEGDAVLLNIYHVMTVNPEMYPMVNEQGALAFAYFLVDPEIQEMIGEFGVDKFGQPLFFPDAGKAEEELGNRDQDIRDWAGSPVSKSQIPGP